MADDHELSQRLTVGLAKTTPALRFDGTLTHLPPDEAPPADASLPRLSLGPALEDAAAPGESAAADLALLETLGEGGMGRVRLARQRSLRREVAVKSLKPGASAAVARALVEEARITGALEHPGVIPVHALGLGEDGLPVLVMKRVEGEEWRLRLAGEERTAERLAANVELLMQVAQTLDFAHSRGVLHLDVKPENVMVGHFGEVYLVDWGAALRVDEAAQHRAHVLGTPAYLAPEMVLGLPLDVRTDVYLLGATLHHLLTGGWRHGGATVQDVLRAAAASAPVAYGPEVPPALAELCNRATSPDAAARPRTAAAFRAELGAYLRGRGAEALTREARARLEECRALLGATGPPAQLAQINRLLTEARFGFEQSLRELPAHGPAAEGLRACTRLQVELELRLEHGVSARALLADLPAPDAELVQRVTAAEERERARGAAASRLEALERDRSPGLGRRERVRALLIFAVSAFAPSMGFELSADFRPTPWSLVGVNAALALLATVMLRRWGRFLAGNAFNRQLLGPFMVMLFGGLLSRTAAAAAGASVDQMLLLDLTLYFAVLASTAASVMPALAWPALATAAGLAAARLWPHSIRIAFAVSDLVMLVSSAYVLEQHARKVAGGRPAARPPTTSP